MSGLSLLQSWRRFPFFDRERVKDPENPDQPYAGLQDVDVVSSCSGNGILIVGERDGGVYQISRNLDANYFRAHKVALYQLVFVRQHNILITVGEDDLGVNPYVKVWLLEKVDKQGTPFCCRCSKTSPSNRPVKVSSLAVHSSMQLIAVGFEDSSVLLYRGDVSKEKQSKCQLWRDGLTCAEDGAVVGLAFHTLAADKTTAFYVATTHALFSYVLGSKDKDTKPIRTYKEGCAAKCWTIADQEFQYQFVVGRREGVYFYQHDDKASCHLFDGEKVLLKTLNGYLFVVYRDVNTPDVDKEEKMNLLTVYDVANFYVAYNAPIPQVVDIFYEWNSYFVLTKSGKMYELLEKDTQTKLDILFRKNLYDLAAKLAESHQLDEQSLSNIYKQYGDFLYSKNDFSNAVKQYIKTIGRLEPSYVLRKFLDSQRIEQMTEYLEALHKTDVADQNHTTILLNCYTKLSDSSKIEKFIKANEHDNYFDVDTALKVLRGSGYSDHALSLAKRNHRHDLYVQMMIEDRNDYAAAVQYISSLNFNSAVEYSLKYGKCLCSEAPDALMALAKELCAGTFRRKDGSSTEKANVDDFLTVFHADPKMMLQFLEHMMQIDPDNLQPTTLHSLLEMYLRNYSLEKDAERKTDMAAKMLTFLKRFHAKFELDQALILCQTNNFDAGVVYLYEITQMPQQILQLYIRRNDYLNVLETCKKYSSDAASKEMWTQALWYFSRCDDVPSKNVEDLLKNVEELKILPPLMVLEILSRSKIVTLGIVKDYLLNWLKNENQEIQSCEDRIGEYKKEIESNKSILQDLATKPQIFQVSKCSACDTPLETPTVHFLCKHSYHQHCFESYAENESECPVCLPEHKKLKALISAQCQQAKDSYQQFRIDLSRSSDAIATVAEYIGKGAFHGKMEDVTVGGAAVSVPKQIQKKSLNPFDE